MIKVDLNNILNKVLNNLGFKKIVQHKNFSAGVITVLIVISLFDILFILLPEIKTTKTLNQKIKKEFDNLNSCKNELSNVDKLKEILSNKEKEINSEEKDFLAEEDFEFLVEDISKNASNSNIKILQLKPLREGASQEKKIRDEVYVKMPILIQAVADYHALGKFLSMIEKSNKFYSVKGLELLANIGDYKKSNVSMSIMTVLKIKQK